MCVNDCVCVCFVSFQINLKKMFMFQVAVVVFSALKDYTVLQTVPMLTTTNWMTFYHLNCTNFQTSITLESTQRYQLCPCGVYTELSAVPMWSLHRAISCTHVHYQLCPCATTLESTQSYQLCPCGVYTELSAVPMCTISCAHVESTQSYQLYPCALSAVPMWSLHRAISCAHVESTQSYQLYPCAKIITSSFNDLAGRIPPTKLMLGKRATTSLTTVSHERTTQGTGLGLHYICWLDCNIDKLCCKKIFLT